MTVSKVLCLIRLTVGIASVRLSLFVCPEVGIVRTILREIIRPYIRPVCLPPLQDHFQLQTLLISCFADVFRRLYIGYRAGMIELRHRGPPFCNSRPATSVIAHVTCLPTEIRGECTQQITLALLP